MPKGSCIVCHMSAPDGCHMTPTDECHMSELMSAKCLRHFDVLTLRGFSLVINPYATLKL
jgi:hypothetical protein